MIYPGPKFERQAPEPIWVLRYGNVSLKHPRAWRDLRSALGRSSPDLPRRWMPWSCRFYSAVITWVPGRCLLRTRSLHFSELSSCSTVFLYCSSLCLPSSLAPCLLPRRAVSTTGTRKARYSITSRVFCILRSEKRLLSPLCLQMFNRLAHV